MASKDGTDLSRYYSQVSYRNHGQGMQPMEEEDQPMVTAVHDNRYGYNSGYYARGGDDAYLSQHSSSPYDDQDTTSNDQNGILLSYASHLGRQYRVNPQEHHRQLMLNHPPPTPRQQSTFYSQHNTLPYYSNQATPIFMRASSPATLVEPSNLQNVNSGASPNRKGPAFLQKRLRGSAYGATSTSNNSAEYAANSTPHSTNATAAAAAALAINRKRNATCMTADGDEEISDKTKSFPNTTMAVDSANVNDHRRSQDYTRYRVLFSNHPDEASKPLYQCKQCDSVLNSKAHFKDVSL